MDVSESELHELYVWVDAVPFSRPKKNITRDFADGVLMAELMHHYLPKLVEVHNYSSANSHRQKTYNWHTLNRKVFKKIGVCLHANDIDRVVHGEGGAVERVLKLVQIKIAQYQGKLTARRECNIVDMYSEQGQDKYEIQSPEQRPSNLSQADASEDDHDVVAGKVHAQKIVIEELRGTNLVLEEKISKLEQLIHLKDAKINTLMATRPTQ